VAVICGIALSVISGYASSAEVYTSVSIELGDGASPVEVRVGELLRDRLEEQSGIAARIGATAPTETAGQ